jgi:RNA-binding protein NOB1
MSLQETKPVEKQTKKSLVIDTNVFIKHLNFASLLQEYDVITTKSVISELRDARAKQRAKLHFKEFKILIPDKTYLNKVMDFARSTGDSVSLSLADVEVIALACEKMALNGNEDKIRYEP